MLTIRNLQKQYVVRGGLLRTKQGVVHAVNDLHLHVRHGETLGLVGESGCGKSTLARLILGLETPTSGEIILKNTPLEQWQGQHLRRTVQMIFQDPYSSLNPRWTVGSIVREPLDILGRHPLEQRRKKTREMLSRVGLGQDDMARYPHEFSGGQRQRVAIARALAPEPELVVCDEPVSALDVSIRAQVLNLLHSLQKDMGLTYLFISHDLSVISHLCDRVAVMYLGSVVELAPRQSFFKTPRHPYSAALLTAVPIPDPSIPPQEMPLTGELPSPLSPPQGCPFHPRCPQAMDICSRQKPTFREIQPGHHVACWLYEATTQDKRNMS